MLQLNVVSWLQLLQYITYFFHLQKRLMNAAKKAITKMPLQTVKNGDKVKALTIIITLIVNPECLLFLTRNNISEFYVVNVGHQQIYLC